MKLPSLKNIGIGIAKAILPRSLEEKFGITQKPMTFEVGAGMTTEQTKKAYEKISQPTVVVKEPGIWGRPNFEETANVYANLSARKIKGEKLAKADEELLKKSEEDVMLTGLGFISMGGNFIKNGATPAREVAETATQKFIKVLKEAKPVRGAQEAIYTAERAQKLAKSLAIGQEIGGEAGFYAEKAALSGELPKVQFDAIRKNLTQVDIDNLFNQVKSHPLLSEWDKLPARQGLLKSLEGTVPTENELSLLNKVFGDEFVQTILEKRPLLNKLKDAGYQIANLPRSVMSSFDLSAPLRQGGFLIGRPKQFLPAFRDMFKYFGSEKAFVALQEEIAQRPTNELMRKSGLSLTDMGYNLSGREEQFMSSWAEKIPLIRASGRAYAGFLNKLRADVFDDLVKKAAQQGLKTDIKLTKGIASFVNNATGRGSLGALEGSAKLLNTIFYSPRLISSRLTLLNPVYYVKAEPFVRKEALKSLFSFVGTGLTVAGLAKMAGAEVGTDSNSADFLKIKIGNTRIDTWAGFQQYVRSASQLLSGKYISSTTGKEITLGEGYKSLTKKDILQMQVESKYSPAFSFINSLLTGKDFEGNQISVPKEIGKRFVPMALGDLIGLARDNPELLPLGLLGIFGVGVQTYKATGIKPKGLPSLKMGGTELPSLKIQ